MERYLEPLYTLLTTTIDLTPALSRKLVGMARDYLERYGLEEFRTEFPTPEVFVYEGIRSLNSDADTRHYVMSDPFARTAVQTQKPKPTKTAPTLPAPQPTPPSSPTPAPQPAPQPAPAPEAPKPKKEKKKEKKAKETDPDIAFLQSEIARQEAEARDQEDAQMRLLADLERRALAGDPDALSILRNFHTFQTAKRR